MKEYLVHIVNHVSNWVVTQVHTIAANDSDAVSQACAAFGIPVPDEKDGNEALRVIPQVLKEVADDTVKTTEAAVEAEPLPVTVPEVLTEAEQVAARVIAALPPDVLAAILAVKGE